MRTTQPNPAMLRPSSSLRLLAAALGLAASTALPAQTRLARVFGDHMVLQREQPLRSVVLARVVVQLARALRTAPAGTRVAPPELLWRAAQPEADAPALLHDWLQGTGPLPEGSSAHR